MFTECDKQKFIGSIKTSFEKRQSILRHGMSLSDAFTYAYLDLSRTPLRGIKNYLASSSPTMVRAQCIEDIILPFCRSTFFPRSKKYNLIKPAKNCLQKFGNFIINTAIHFLQLGKRKSGSIWG